VAILMELSSRRYCIRCNSRGYYEQPLVVPQLSHFRHVPLRTSVN